MYYPFHDSSAFARYRSQPSPLQLKDEEFQLLQNVRSASGDLTVRGGSALVNSIVSGGEYRGSAVFRFRGSYVMFVAVYVPLSTKVRVYRFPGVADPTAWEEITREFSGVNPGDTGIGPYNLTRMTDDGPVWFEFVQDPDQDSVTFREGSYPSLSQDVVRFGNRTEYPRAYGAFYGGNTLAVTNDVGSLQTAIIEPIDPPTAAQAVGVTATMVGSSGFPLRDAANTAYRNSTANFTLADAGGSATDNYAVLTVTATAAVNDTAVMDINSGGVNGSALLLGGKQLHIGIDTAWVGFLSAVKIEVGNEAAGVFTSAATIWNGATGSLPYPVISVLSSNKQLYSFDVEQFYSASSYDALRFTFLGPVVTTPKTVNIFYVCPGPAIAGANPGQSLWAITWKNSGSHSESPRVLLRNPNYPMRLEALGGNELPDSYADLSCPSSADLYFGFNGPVPNPTQAMIDKGVDGAVIYRKRPADGDYFPVEFYELAIYSETAGTPPTAPVWSFTGSTSANQVRRVGFLGRRHLSTTPPPPDLHLVMPKATAAVQANGRSFVGVYTATGTQRNFMYSGFQQPFRFLAFDDIDQTTGDFRPLSPGYINLQGDQIRALVAVSASDIGMDSAGPTDQVVVAFGEMDVFVAGGKTQDQIRRISPVGIPGTISPFSVSVGRQWIYYVDRYMMPRRFRAGSADEQIGLQRVDDLKGVPSAYRPYIGGCYHDSKWFVPFVPEGETTPVGILVWDDFLEDWVSRDVPPLPTEGMVSYFDATLNRMRLIAFMQITAASTTLRAVEYDGTATLDFSSLIPVRIRTLEMHSKDWSVVSGRKFGLVMQAVANAEATVVLTYKPSGATRTTTISLADSGSWIRRTDRPELSVETGETKGGSVEALLSMDVPGGTRILAFGLDIHEYEDEFESPAPP